MMQKKLVFLYKYQKTGLSSPSWELMPEDLATIIIKEYFFKQANGIGFGGYKSKKEAQELKLFSTFSPNYKFTKKYKPWDGIDSSTYDVAVFSFDNFILEALINNQFTKFEAGTKGYDTDEIIFFSDTEELGRIIPYESRFEFNIKSNNMEQELLNLDHRIKGLLEEE